MFTVHARYGHPSEWTVQQGPGSDGSLELRCSEHSENDVYFTRSNIGLLIAQYPQLINASEIMLNKCGNFDLHFDPRIFPFFEKHDNIIY